MKFLRLLPVLLFAVFIGLYGFTKLHSQNSDASPILRQPVPSFSVPDGLHANQFLTSAHMTSPSLLVFWASWCGVCKVDLPVLGRFAKTHNIPVYAIAYHDEPQILQAALNDLGKDIHFTGLGLDPNGAVAAKFGIIGIPTLFVIDGKGRVAYVLAGQVSQHILEHDVWPLLH